MSNHSWLLCCRHRKPPGRTTGLKLLFSPCFCLYLWRRSHGDPAQAEAAVQRERGGQEAQAPEGSQRGELRSSLGFGSTASRMRAAGGASVLQNKDVALLSGPPELFYQTFLCLLCSSETFIWSCTGTFRAGVSFLLSLNTFIRVVFLSKREIKRTTPLFSAPQCLCCPGSFRLTLVKSTNRELISGNSRG